jgi:hypothetical protein
VRCVGDHVITCKVYISYLISEETLHVITPVSARVIENSIWYNKLIGNKEKKSERRIEMNNKDPP